MKYIFFIVLLAFAIISLSILRRIDNNMNEMNAKSDQMISNIIEMQKPFWEKIK